MTDPIMTDLNMLIIRPMTREDVDTVMLIELASFRSPWGRSHFTDELNNPDLSLPLVMEKDGVMVAFTVMWFIVDECHLANIAVHPDHRRKGYGQRLLEAVIAEARKHSCGRVMLEVRRSNTDAIRMYERNGFKKVGVRKNYYHDGFMQDEDAILMDLELKRENV